MKHSSHTIRYAASAGHESSGKQPPVRAGFTLLEMMVAIGLVMLIMLMFAKIFEVTAGTMGTQKGLAKNDQKVRSFTVIMKEDLEHRTFRRVVPFFPGQDTGSHGPFYSPQERRGYFSISENDPNNNTDDVLAFTAQFPVPVSGKALALALAPIDWNLDKNLNQPVFDDGIPDNSTGSSRSVEIVYFLRYGKLYRRVMLIREPYEDEGKGAQPGELLDDYKNFWRDFDYSAYRKFPPAVDAGVKFHDAQKALNNNHPADNVDAQFQYPISLGVPHLRFGHSVNRRDGTPREFVGTNKDQFIGRFTTQETAHSGFGYPGGNFDPHNDENPLSLETFGIYAGLVSGLSVEADGTTTNRRGEDILLSNVHEFDIKVWDDYDEDFNQNRKLDSIEDFNGNNRLDSVMAFVDLGHDRTVNGKPVGYYNQQPFPDPDLGPLGWINKNYGRRYDTWHPFPPLGFPPFRPLHPFNGDDGVFGTFQNDDLMNDPNDLLEQGFLGSDDEVPLKAIQITIRFFDVESDQMRQLTLIHTLTN
jgi:hypothetical protein